MLKLPFPFIIPVNIVPELVVGGEGDHTAPGNAQRKEDLDTGISPHLDKDRDRDKDIDINTDFDTSHPDVKIIFKISVKS